MTSGEFNFDDAIRSAEREIARTAATLERQAEFWKGYQSAMREVQRYVKESR